MGVPVDSRDYQRCHITEFTVARPATLEGMLVSVVDPQGSFLILRLSAASRISFFHMRSLPPELTRQTTEVYDTLIE